MESKLEECREELKECGKKETVRIFKHMEALKRDFSEYINNADEDDIEHIKDCCELFKNGEYKCTGEKVLLKCTGEDRKSDLMFLKPIKKGFEKVRDPDVSINEKPEILSHPWFGHGTSTLLASTLLPALVSLLRQ